MIKFVLGMIVGAVVIIDIAIVMAIGDDDDG